MSLQSRNSTRWKLHPVRSAFDRSQFRKVTSVKCDPCNVHAREKAACEKTRLHPDMFPVEVRENNAAENASGNLFAFGQRPTIGIFHGIGGRDRSGYLHRQIQ